MSSRKPCTAWAAVRLHARDSSLPHTAAPKPTTSVAAMLPVTPPSACCGGGIFDAIDRPVWLREHRLISEISLNVSANAARSNTSARLTSYAFSDGIEITFQVLVSLLSSLPDGGAVASPAIWLSLVARPQESPPPVQAGIPSYLVGQCADQQLTRVRRPRSMYPMPGQRVSRNLFRRCIAGCQADAQLSQLVSPGQTIDNQLCIPNPAARLHPWP